MAKRKSTKGQIRSRKHTYKTKDLVTRTPLKTGGELMCSGRLCSSCSTSETRRVNLVTNSVISHEWVKDREEFTTSGIYPWSFVTQIFHNGHPSHGGDNKIFEVMTSTYAIYSDHLTYIILKIFTWFRVHFPVNQQCHFQLNLIILSLLSKVPLYVEWHLEYWNIPYNCI